VNMPQDKDVNRAETLLHWAVEDVIYAESAVDRMEAMNKVVERVLYLSALVSVEWAKEALAKSCNGVIIDNLEDY
jgi:hypothetical protein